MDTTEIKGYLNSKIIAGSWRRFHKFGFDKVSEFAIKDINGCNLIDLVYGDIVKGSVPNAGVCRVFAATATGRGDCTAYVITNPEDEKIVFTSASFD